VTMESGAALAAAAELNNTDFMGRTIRVNEAAPPGEGGGRGRGGGYGGGGGGYGGGRGRGGGSLVNPGLCSCEGLPASCPAQDPASIPAFGEHKPVHAHSVSCSYL